MAYAPEAFNNFMASLNSRVAAANFTEPRTGSLIAI